MTPDEFAGKEEKTKKLQRKKTTRPEPPFVKHCLYD